MTRTARSLKFNPVVYTPKPGEPKWEYPVLRGTPPPMETIGPYDHSKDKRGIQLLKGDLKIANAKDPINLFRKDGVTPLAEMGARTNRGMMLKNAAIKQGKEHLLYGYKDTPEDIKTYQDLRKSNPGLFE